MHVNKKTLAVFTAGVLAVGGVASIGAQTYAQTTGTTSVSPSNMMSKLWHHGMDNDADDNVVLPQGGITEAQARSAITTAYPALTIKHVELEDDNGTVVYGAKLSDGSEVMVDVHTSAVTVEAPDQEDKEHQGRDGKGHGGKEGRDQNEAAEVQGTETSDGAQGPTDKGEVVKTQSAGTSSTEVNDIETNDGAAGPTDATTTTN